MRSGRWIGIGPGAIGVRAAAVRGLLALAFVLGGVLAGAEDRGETRSAKNGQAAAGDVGTVAGQTAAITKGQRLFTCGHSFHILIYRLVGEMASAAGIEDHTAAGVSSIGGSRVIQHWDVADEKNLAKERLKAGAVDALTLSPIWFPDEGIEKFAKLGVAHNPKIRIFVQEFWLPNDTYEPIYPLDTRKKVDHNATDLVDLRKKQTQYLKDVDAVANGINTQLGQRSVYVVPVGQAVLALREKLAAGKAPGLKMQWDLFRDPWGHATAPVTVLSGYCHFAAIYRRSPVGLPVPKDLNLYRRYTTDVSLRKPGWRPTPEEIKQAEPLAEKDLKELNRLLQELAWEAVSKHPTSGIAAEPTGK